MVRVVGSEQCLVEKISGEGAQSPTSSLLDPKLREGVSFGTRHG
jgi:hypothetical protein